MTAKSTSKIDPALEKAVKKMLADVMKDSTATLTDRCKVVDRALKLQAIKAKMDDTTFGSGFHDDDEGEG